MSEQWGEKIDKDFDIPKSGEKIKRAFRKDDYLEVVESKVKRNEKMNYEHEVKTQKISSSIVSFLMNKVYYIFVIIVGFALGLYIGSMNEPKIVGDMRDLCRDQFSIEKSQLEDFSKKTPSLGGNKFTAICSQLLSGPIKSSNIKKKP